MQKNVLEYFESSVVQHDNKTAIIDGEKSITFGELWGYSRRLAFRIKQTKDKVNQPIAVFLPKSGDSIIAFMGILCSGNIYVPMDTKSPPARVRSIVENLENPIIITSEEHYDTLLESGVDQDHIIDISLAYDQSIKYDNNLVSSYAEPVIDTDPIYIIYTSGSTGTPKGVVVSHRGVIDYIDWAIDCFDITAQEIIGSQAPFYFDNSTLDIYLCLATGATLVLIPEQYFAFPIRLMEYVAERNINFIFWVPSVMINVANTRALDHVRVDCLKKILFAGEVMPVRHLNYWRQNLCGR